MRLVLSCVMVMFVAAVANGAVIGDFPMSDAAGSATNETGGTRMAETIYAPTVITGGSMTTPAGATAGGMQYTNFTQYFNQGDASGWGANTMWAIINVAEQDGARHTLVEISGAYGQSADARGGMRWAIRDGMSNAGLSLFQWPNAYWQNAAQANIFMVGVGMPVGDYFVAASWVQDGAFFRQRLYQRPIGGEQGAWNQANHLLTIAPYAHTEARLSIGRRWEGNDLLEGGMDHLQILGDFTDTMTEFDALYSSIVPEPVSMLLLGLGGVALLRRRR